MTGLRRTSRRLLVILLLVVASASRPGSAPGPAYPDVLTRGPVLPRPYVQVPPGGSRVLPADLDGDPYPDLLVVSRGRFTPSAGYSGGKLSLLYGLGDGTFAAPATLTTGGSSYEAAIGDLNGDGHNDVIVANYLATNVRVYLSNGQRGFTGPVTSSTGGAVYGLAVGDFNEDGRMDVAASLYYSDEVAILIGRGDGGLTLATRMPAGNGPSDLAVGDLDEDGHADLVVAAQGVNCAPEPGCSPEPGDLSRLRGLGDGLFAPPIDLIHGPRFIRLALGDFNGDGHLDIAASGFGDPPLPSGVMLVPGGGPAGPGAPVTLIGGDRSFSDLIAVDANGDPFKDLIFRGQNLTTYRNETSLVTLLMKGDGTFEEVDSPPLPFYASALGVADFNLDGLLDAGIVYSTGGGQFPDIMEVLTGAGPGRFTTETCLASGGLFQQVATPDLNGDGAADILAYDIGRAYSPGTQPNLRILLAEGGGMFREMPAVVLPGSAFDSNSTELFTVADFDRDGIPDVALLAPGQKQIVLLHGRGDGTFATTGTLGLAGFATAVVSGRFNGGDYAPSLAVVIPCGDVTCTFGRVALYDGPSLGYSGPINSSLLKSGVFGYPFAAVAADFDEDGRDDLVILANYFSSFCKGDGLSLDDCAPLPLSRVYGGGAASDVNRDGHLDLIAGGVVLRGLGDGTFENPSSVMVADQGATVAGDMNGDGWPDIVSGSLFQSGLTVNLSDGSGGFRPAAGHLIYDPALGLALLDFDGDSRLDTVFGFDRLCIAPNVSGSPDADADGVPDAVDPCIDSDDDGFADRLTSTSTCPLDNCAAVANADQLDVDGDGLGDACDPCPRDARNDPDHDGVCEGVDLCPGVHDPLQEDQDGDGIGDACDNCLFVASPDQTDSNGDGAGDVCQPRLALTGIVQDGGEALEVFAAASDPQGNPIISSLTIAGPPAGFTVPNLAQVYDYCDPANALIFGTPGEGIGYASFGDGRFLFDLDGGIGCVDYQQDYEIALGPCDALTEPFTSASGTLDLDQVALPAQICIARYPSIDGFQTLTVLSADDQEVRLSYSAEETPLSQLYAGGFPDRVTLPSLRPGVTYDLRLEVSNGQTRSAQASLPFVYQGESYIGFDPDSDHDGLTDDIDPCVDPDADGFGNRGAPSTTCALDKCQAVGNPGQEDADADGVGDACDECNDPDHDGYGSPGSPGFPAPTCAIDNCPDIANPYQSDQDHDGIGDECDPCNDPDGDGFGSGGGPRTCPLDNCPFWANPDQSDADGDGEGDVCDACTDTDGDGRGDPGYPANSCFVDNCPGVPNADQRDTDHDGAGDVCDACTDTDHDGFGNPGFPANTCPVDNCPAASNPSQADADGDGIGDACDACMDRDGDGFGDPGFPANTCATDNCPSVSNPSQADADGDGLGDACDPCPHDALNDADQDGLCGDLDNCPAIANPGQQDADGDGVGDSCDNCIAAPNPAQADADGDGAGDECDACTDTDHDGFGNPGFPANTCPMDNCPLVTNTSQVDADGDGVGDACDICTDIDRDGFGDPGFPLNTCATDNCPSIANPAQSDADGDGTGDACDPCTDTDRDGFGNPGFPANACGTDNCPLVANPSQANADGDDLGDACDPCTDTDADGFGDPGFPLNTCARDNCPSFSNPSQTDADGDGLGDPCDPCPRDALNDVDRDGVCGDLDNCPSATNADQQDSDGDGIGNVCDNCPIASNASQSDSDRDGVGDACDNCAGVINLDQRDEDGDGLGNACDNCPATPNAGQEDGNGDGSGDACQPTLVFTGVRQEGGPVLTVRAAASDPQDDALSGRLDIIGVGALPVTLQDAVAAFDCGLGYFPEGIAGEGIGFTYGAVGQPYLFDLDSNIGCLDQVPDYVLALGTCNAPGLFFDNLISLDAVVPPAAVCIRKVQESSGGITLTILSFDMQSLTGSVTQGNTGVLGIPFSGRLPRQADLTGLESGSSYRLSLTVTDGNTVPVSAGAEFIYQGETHLVINNPSHAAIATPAAVECDRPEGGVVTLDGSASEDIDSSPGTHDDIASYEWLEDAGLPAERILGTGPVLAVTLPLGAHRVTLRVTDIYGETDLGNTTITVQDTAPPLLSCPQVEPSECAGPEGTEVSLVAAATDVCGAAPRVTNSRNGNGADASGDYPLGTTSVTFTATDAAGNIATCAVPVTVRDTQPSVLTLPAALTVDATTPAGAVVTYAASARDTCAGSVMAVCTPPSGSTFPINAPGQVTMVACKATDGAHNGTTGSFTVHVAGAAEQLEALRAVLESFHFHGGLANDLDNKLNEALKELGKGKPDHACKKLEEFSKKVTQESTKKKPKITPGQASTMMTAARRIGGVLGCGAGP